MTTTPMTRHCCIGFGIERGIYESNVVYVDGEPRSGARMALLDDLLVDTYQREADSLLGDLEALGGALLEADGRRGTASAATLATKLRHIAAALTDLRPPPPVALTDQLAGETEAEYTWDGTNGGKPIPPAPVIDAREESDHGTDDEPVTIEEAAS